MHILTLQKESYLPFEYFAFRLFGANEGLYELCCSVIQRAALHSYPPVPAGMVGVLSLFSNAVFMATKTEEQTRAQIILRKLTACCSSRGMAIFSIYISRLGNREHTHVHIPFIFAVMCFCMKWFSSQLNFLFDQILNKCTLCKWTLL